MTDKDDELDLALELRELADRFSEGWHDGIKIDASDIMLLAMAASQIEQARSAPVQEPVGVYGHCPVCGAKGVTRERRPDGDDRCANGHTYKSIHATTPSAQRQWVGLTDIEKLSVCRVGPVYAPDGVVTRTPVQYRKELEGVALMAVRQAEAKLKEKNGG
jgi:hypothetical protein